MPFTHTYTPKAVKDIVGQADALAQILDFVRHYKSQKKKALLLHGPTGTGKTSAAYAIARDVGAEIFELNSSDFRNKEQIQLKLGSAMGQQSLFAKQKLLLVDDIDALSGTKDRGGIAEVVRLIQQSSYPVILTVQNPYNNKLSALRSKSMMVSFDPIAAKDMVPFLSRISSKEKLELDEKILSSIARRSGGDMRAALNDLEVISYFQGENPLDVLGEREKEASMIDALLKIFKTSDPKVAISAFDYVKEDLDEQILWIDENLPKEYESPADLARAYEFISDADIFQRRIRRWQHWRFLVYVNALLTAGVAVSKENKYQKFVEYKPTGRILKLWWAKQKQMKKLAIAEKIAAKTHTSKHEAVQSMPYFQVMFSKGKNAREFIEYLDLDKEEVEWLRK